MKGLRLFVRRAIPDDQTLLLSFWKNEARDPHPEDSDGLIGFLLGDPAAFLSFIAEGDALVIRDLWVAQNLRRKRIARAMVAELEAEAERLGLVRLAARPSAEFIEPFLRLGFFEAPDGTLVKPLERAR